jgi:EpsI family protein
VKLRGPWALAGILATGAVLATAGVNSQRSLPLRVPLSEAVPDTLGGLRGQDFKLPPAEAAAAGVTTYLARNYTAGGAGGETAVALYIGYYAQQAQGQTIHSPKNCLPGAGWEPLASAPQTLATALGAVTVNRYVIQNGKDRAVVLYWYQGRGRVAWNEYRVKWDLLRDAALRRRSDEALVRIVVPVRGSDAAALQAGVAAATVLVPALARALPA